LITLLKAGVSFIKAMEIIIKNMRDGNFKDILIQIESDIKNGVQISDAFSSSQIPFKKIYRASLLAGERSGNLESVLEKFNTYLEKVTNLRRKTFSSLSYPIILFVFMVTMVLLILLYAIPKFSSFYESFRAGLPATTTMLISIAEFAQKNIHYFVLPILILYVSLKLVERSSEKIAIMDYLKYKIPFIGRIIVENAMAIFSRTLSILISGGIPVPESTAIAVETFSNRYFFIQVKDIASKIKEGNLLSDVLSEVDFIPGMMVEVVRVGESSGNLPEVLNKNADYYENAINLKVNTIISLIEPVLIIFLGLVIAFMLISVYLPIFQTIQVVR
jgi:type IV pilus assembly protein PilC